MIWKTFSINTFKDCTVFYVSFQWMGLRKQILLLACSWNNDTMSSYIMSKHSLVMFVSCFEETRKKTEKLKKNFTWALLIFSMWVFYFSRKQTKKRAPWGNNSMCNPLARSGAISSAPVNQVFQCISWVKTEILHVIILVKNTELKQFNKGNPCSSGLCITTRKKNVPRGNVIVWWQLSKFMDIYLQGCIQPFTAVDGTLKTQT